MDKKIKKSENQYRELFFWPMIGPERKKKKTEKNDREDTIKKIIQEIEDTKFQTQKARQVESIMNKKNQHWRLYP